MVPRGSARASWKISAPASHDDRSSGSVRRAHEPPTWATTITTAAPRRRRSLAANPTVGARGRARSPTKFAGNVMAAVPTFTRPMIPIPMLATVNSFVPATLGQAGGAPVASTIRFAARRARRRRGADGAEIELVVADGGGVVPERVVRADDRRALGEVRLQGSLEHVTAVEQHDASAAVRSLPPEVREIAAKAWQRLEVSMEIVRADDRDRDVGFASLRRRRNQQHRGEDDRAH